MNNTHQWAMKLKLPERLSPGRWVLNVQGLAATVVAATAEIQTEKKEPKMGKIAKTLASTTRDESAMMASNMNDLDSGDVCEQTTNNGFELDPITTTPLSKVYPSVACSAAYLKGVSECSPGLAGDIAAWGHSGYMLADGRLVPTSLIADVRHALSDTMLTYGDVIQVEQLFAPDFLNSLDPAKRDVLAHVVMRLIELGSVAMHFPSLDVGAA